jgi:hypothetical protein
MVLPANARCWILMVLVMHMAVHPMLHGFTQPSSTSHVHVKTDGAGTADSFDRCDLCRVGHSATVMPKPARIQFLNPDWIPVRIKTVSYASLQVTPRLPSRAPPSL